MATSTIEQLRQLNEDLENFEKAGAKLVAEKRARAPTSKAQVIIDHLLKRLVDSSKEESEKVLALYADKDGLRKEEIAIFGGSKPAKGGEFAPNGATSGDPASAKDVGVWTNFYDKLKVIKDYHRRNATSAGNSAAAAATVASDAMVADLMKHGTAEVEKLFTGEEDVGRKVDMMGLFSDFCNLGKYRRHREQEHRKTELSRLRRRKGVKAAGEGEAAQASSTSTGGDEEEGAVPEFQEIDYITYLKTFDKLSDIPRFCKYRDGEYQAYIAKLLDYVSSFFARQNPLVDEEKLLSEFDFDTQWTDGSLSGWAQYTHKLPLYSLPADKLFASEGTFQGHQQGKKYQKELQALQAKSMEEQKDVIEQSEALDHTMARQEALIRHYRELLTPAIDGTVEHLQKKQSRGLREILGEAEASDDEANEADDAANVLEEESGGETDDDDEKPIYNPLNLPLGWDGKPIPFWLYKLHGLGKEFKCEICGNCSYWGRRAFERHFQEWRHAFGMRCLKIPNTAHFKEITKIEEAISLYEKLKRDAEAQSFVSEKDVECEDTEGNVMSAKAFEDLRREGLL